MRRKQITSGATATVLIAMSVAGGYLLGRSDAPTAQDAREARLGARALAAASAEQRAARRAWQNGHTDGLRVGVSLGRQMGQENGEVAGREAASQQLAAQAERELTYTSHLPNGDPGYVLPEDERSLSCVGYSAIDGECVGD